MSAEFGDAVKAQLEAQGVRSVHEADWSPELALSVLRENRRRYAHEPSMQAMDSVAAKLARQLAAQTGVKTEDIVTVLLHVSAKLASLSLLADLPGTTFVEIMQCAADDLDQQAKAGEQP